MITLELGNIYIKLVFDDTVSDRTKKWLWDQIHQKLDPLDPQRFHNRLFNLFKNGKRVWDGRISLCNPKESLVPLGFYDRLVNILLSIGKQTQLSYKTVDKRGPALRVKIPDEIYIDGHGLEKSVTLRDYQYQGVKDALKEQDGIILNATNSGKSLVAISLYKYLLPIINKNEHLLFIAPNKSIMEQLYTKFSHYIGEEYCGIWGNGKKDLHKKIVCATIQTIASAIKKPDIKLTSKKEKRLQRLVTKYAPLVIEDGDPRSNLELLARNFRPKYKYEIADLEELRNIYMTLQTSSEVVDYFKKLDKKYKKVMYKHNEKAFKKYNEAIEFLKAVRATICDEVHFAGAPSYWNVFQYLNNSRMKIGLTGTLDKTKTIEISRIRALFGKDLTDVTNKEMIERGVSARPHIKMVPITKPENLVKRVQATMVSRGYNELPTADLLSYQVAYELGVVHNEYRNHLIAELAYKASLKINKQAVLIMVTSIEHGELIGEQLSAMGAEYQFLQGKDDEETRKEAIDRIISGKLKIVIATKIFEAGIDIPNLKVLILCDALKSYISVLQKIGRVLRILPDKRDVYIYDIADRTDELLFKHAQERYRYYKQEGFEVS